MNGKIIKGLLAAWVSLVLGGCGAKASSSVITDCILPDDQVGTLSGKWKKPAVPIAFHQGDFTPAEMNTIVQAANTWNDFYGQSLGMSAIDYGSAASPRTSSVSRPTSSILCSESLVTGNSYTGEVVLYKDGSWPYSNQSGVIALTTFCRSAGTPLPYFYMAIMDLNYQNFFIAGKRNPDLQTIILHEFGHLMGLNHSCENTGRTGVPSCVASGLNPDYISALMFPTFSFDSSGNGQIKRELQANDQGRANCLYME